MEDNTQVIRTVTSGRPPPGAKRDRCTLTVIAGPTPGTLFVVDQELIIGRGVECSAWVDDPGLSRRHARVFRQDDNFFVEDLGSTNGTFIDGNRLHAPRILDDGDRIMIGKSTVLRVTLQDAAEQEVLKNVYDAAVRDPMTHLYNRRFLDERLDTEFAYATRHASELSVLMLDIDHFKQVNDTHGHAAGDEVLRVTAAALQRALRAEDIAARFGGEEFCILVRGIDENGAFIIAERIRSTVRNLEVLVDGRPLRVTVSIGVSCFSVNSPQPSAQSLLAAADRALYEAKDAGRDRTVRSSTLQAASFK